ncbi:hypothetical protein [Streptomyces spectabilis]|uniref:DUF4352 domain-containing protein n=1 Tax=Streptomyces spectabilis TaxID=68270 RepID=A0A5P2XBE1_STRST|nr:hypothetical protein [Streptomyces spectabilis]MBB5109486.1 hypothetical protein [Streptomyces spectabilis]MCI3904643.1 hypothetical protein [Streptomyces spectabilis]QEV61721.1 hypothetical protein CP982_25910 [Streptomyces spectabilis]GGV54623.1 hypothetical protein GCM10010245_86400 [Streptomyces spectabilis]
MSTQRAPQYRRRLGLVAVAAATAVTMTACGGSDDSGKGKDGKSGAEASEAPKNLKVGQPGPAQEITKYNKTGKFSITPTKVTLGKPGDLKELDDEKKYGGKKVAWIYVKAKHVGGEAVKQPIVMTNVNAETSDGNPATKFILIGTLSSQPKDCVGNDGKRTLGGEDIWKKGEERTVCEPYLIPADATVKAVTYSQGFYNEPIKWALK